MAVYSVRGFSAQAAAGSVPFQLWNPDGAQRIKLLELGYYQALDTQTQFVQFYRTTARGTAGSTVTPDADNSWAADDVPPSGALLDLASFSVEPTTHGSALIGFTIAGVIGSAGSGFVWAPAYGLWIPPGKGIALVHNEGNVFRASEVYCVWEEG